VAQFGSEDGFRSDATQQLKNIPREELVRAYEILSTRALDPESAQSLPELTEMVIWSIMVRVDVCIGNIAQEIADQYDLIGSTTSYNQLSTSLLLCEKLKRISPATVTVLGASWSTAGWGRVSSTDMSLSTLSYKGKVNTRSMPWSASSKRRISRPPSEPMGIVVIFEVISSQQPAIIRYYGGV